MPVTTRIVTCTLFRTDGVTPWEGGTIVYKRTQGSYTSSHTLPADTVTVTANELGETAAELWCNAEGLRPSEYTWSTPDGKSGTFILPADAGAISLETLRTISEPYNWSNVNLDDYLNLIRDAIYAAFANTSDAALGDALVGFRQIADNTIGRTVHSKLRETVSVLDFGALGDGTTDDYAAITLALNSGAKRVVFPYSASGYRINTGLIVPPGVIVDLKTRSNKLLCYNAVDTYAVTFRDLLWQAGGGIEDGWIDVKAGGNGIKIYQCKQPRLVNLAITGNGTGKIAILLDGGIGAESEDEDATSTSTGGTTFHLVDHVYIQGFTQRGVQLDTSDFKFQLTRKIGSGTLTATSATIPNFALNNPDVDRINFGAGDHIYAAAIYSITATFGSFVVTMADTSLVRVGGNVVCSSLLYDATVISIDSPTQLTLSRAAYRSGSVNATIGTTHLGDSTTVVSNAGGVITLSTPATVSGTTIALHGRMPAAGLSGPWCNRGVFRMVHVQGGAAYTSLIGFDIQHANTNTFHQCSSQACNIGMRLGSDAGYNDILLRDEGRITYAIQMVDGTIETNYWGETLTRSPGNNYISGSFNPDFINGAGRLTRWNINNRQEWPGQTTLTNMTRIELNGATATQAPLRLVASTAVPTAPVVGDIWNDGTQFALTMKLANLTERFVGCIFAQTADKNVSNGITAVSLVNATSAIGSRNIAGASTAIGKTIRVRMRGYLSTTGTPTLTLRLNLGTVTICATPAVTMAAVTNVGWKLEGEITYRTLGASGTAIGQGEFSYDGGSSRLVALAVSVVDTTLGAAVDVTAQWSAASASNTMTCSNCTIEIVS